MNKKYWLKGAKIYSVFGFIYYLLWLVIFSKGASYDPTQTQIDKIFDSIFNYVEFIGYILFIPLEELVTMMFGFAGYSDTVISIILLAVSLVGWIILGGILGMIYGKIKNRNSSIKI